MTREELLEERCERFRDLIQFLTFYIDDKTPSAHLVTRFNEMVAGGRITANDARYLSGLPELDQATKPPLGVMPRDIWNRKRQKELADVMQRYLEAGKSIPREWIDEYNESSDKEGF